MFDLNLFGETVKPDEHGSGLAKAWEYPPFSVLSARDGWWQERKRQWLSLGIQSELGRGMENLGGAHPETTSTIDFYARKRAIEADLGRAVSKDEAAEIIAAGGGASQFAGTERGKDCRA